MNIASSPPAADTASPGAAASSSPAPAGESGFMALIGALLQGGGLPATAVTSDTETPELVCGDGLSGGDSSETDDAEDPDGLLAALACSAMLAPPAILVAPPAAASEALPPAATTPSRPQVPVASAKGNAASAGAALTGALTTAIEEGTILGAEAAGEVTSPFLIEDSGATGSTASGSASTSALGTWAAAANRLATAEGVSGRAPAVAGESLREPVSSPRWKDELGTHLTLMAVKGQQSGSLRLSPEHLGPLEIQITVGDDKTTSVQFGAHQADTRAALQEALPRLREMFAAAGLQLGDTGVSGQAPRHPSTPASADSMAGDARNDGEPTPVQGLVRSITHSGLLDTYA